MRKLAVWTCAAVVVLAVIVLIGWVRLNLAIASSSGPPFTISRETTRIVEPLRGWLCRLLRRVECYMHRGSDAGKQRGRRDLAGAWAEIDFGR